MELSQKEEAVLEIVEFSDQDPLERFEVIQQLGEGNFGKVFQCRDKFSGQMVACKIVPLTEELESLRKEIQILKLCYSPFVVKYYGSYLRRDGEDQPELWIVLEYCSAGSINDIMKATEK